MSVGEDKRYVNMAKKIRESILPFVVLLAVFVFLAWLIISPLGNPLMWSVVLSYFAYPFYRWMHEKVLRGRFTNLAAALTTGVILVFMLIPLLLLGFFLTRESLRIYESAVRSGLMSGSYSDIVLKLRAVPVLGMLLERFDYLRDLPIFEAMISSAINWLSLAVRVVSNKILGNAFKIFYLLAIVTMTSFFIVRDGHLIIQYMKEILPLPCDARENIWHRAASMLRAVIYGIVFTAGVQGTLGGLGWWYVGLPHPLFFGFLMFIGGMIPFVGTPVVWIPGSIVLLLNGHVASGLLLLAWGFGVVSMIDNFIRPYFISEESKIHMLVIFIGIFGGLFNWGFLGLFVGPLILSVGIFLLDVYKTIISEQFNIKDGPFE